MDNPLTRTTRTISAPPKGWPLIIQTWPQHPPDLRSYSVCHYAIRVCIDQHDARPILNQVRLADAPGVILLEWDIALDGDDLRTICGRASTHPDDGFVAPYKLWPGPSWGHRIMTGPFHDDWWHVDDRHTFEYVRPGDLACNLPCFGCIYLPRHLLEAWEPPPHDPRLTDSNFALWSRSQRLWWPILWEIRPVHLHY